MRTYELMFILDPRLSDDEASSLADEFQKQVDSKPGAEVIKVDHWGRRKLAYEIEKLKEGRYVLFYIRSENGGPFLVDVERRMKQHDHVLRYLTVRTDEGLQRAGLPLPTEEAEQEAEAASTEADSETDGAGKEE